MGEINLQPVERCEVIVLVDNYIDLLLPPKDGVVRPPLATGDVIPEDTILAEHGLSILLRLTYGGETHSVLMDAGYTDKVLPHNLNFLGLSLSDVELVVMSHGHMDRSFRFQGVGNSWARRFASWQIRRGDSKS